MSEASHQRRALDALVERARERATTWFPDLAAAVNVEVEREHRRRRTVVRVLRLSDGTTEQRVVGKTVRVRGGTGPPPPPVGRLARPRIARAAPSLKVAAGWYHGLDLTWRHFSELGDPRFGWIRPLELMPDTDTVVMEYVDHPTLRARIIGSRDGSEASSEWVEEQVENAGAWLREYHALEVGSELTLRCPTRTELIATARALAQYLASRTGDHELLRRVAVAMERSAATALPEELPLGLAHGDYAPRNVFAGPGARVTAFDATPRYRAPMHEDVAHFLVGMRVSGARWLRIGGLVPPDRLDGLEARFLLGYHGAGPPPLQALHLFQLLGLMNKLASIIESRDARSPVRRVRARLRARFYYRPFRAEAQRVLALLDRTEVQEAPTRPKPEPESAGPSRRLS